MQVVRGKQILLAEPILKAAKDVIRERINGEQNLEVYLNYHRDYFRFRGIDVKSPHYKNISTVLDRIQGKRFYNVSKFLLSIEKVYGGSGSFNYYCLPKETILKLIDEVKNEPKI